MTKYFITGGDGFIGYHVCRELLEHTDADIVSYDAHRHYVPLEKSLWPDYLQYRSAQLEGDVTRIQGATTDEQLLSEKLREHEPDVVLHLAALPIATVSNDRPDEARRNILDGTMNLVESLRRANFEVDRTVLVSSSMVYGDFETDERGNVLPASEDDACNPMGVYGSMKLASEHVVKSYSTQYDIPYTIVRPSAVYGPTDCNRRVTEIFLRRALANEPIRLDNGGTQELDFTYVTDLARGIRLAAEHEEARNETFNLTRGEGRSIRELADVIRNFVPDVETYTQYEERSRPNRGALDISKARDLLGYDPRYSLEEGMRRYLQFLENSGFIERLREDRSPTLTSEP